tara:strand:+ start:41 stop:352 length:312 start_codon:yes stop_codon:yes gene_type:complete
MIIDRFDVAIENESVDIPIKAILDECLTFVLDDKKNRADHLAGCHDDVLFAAMIALFVHNQVSTDDVVRKKERPKRTGWSRTPPKIVEDLDKKETEEQLNLWL